MGALVGGGGTNTRNIIKYSSLQVSTSQLDIPRTLFWGQRRISPNCIWYNDFQSHKEGAGKGGGKTTGYTYSAAVILALGQGVMATPLNVWGPSSTTTTTTLAALGLTFVTGTASQPVWSYLTAHYPGQALAYMNTAYVASSNMNLGESASVPDYAFEMQRLMGFANTLVAAGWTNPTTGANTAGTDISLADAIADFLTSTIYGMGFGAGDIADMTVVRAYQAAQGLYFSPCLTSQEKATEILDRWATLANTWIYWSGTQVQFVCLGDSALSANGYSYTPDLAAAYNLGFDDFLADRGAAPVEVDRQDPADCYNRTVLEICDRTRGYVSSPVEYKDQQLVARYGLRDNSSTQADEVCNPAVGAICAQLIGKRAAYVRNTYKFKLSYRYIRLLPGSIVTLTEPNIGLDEFPVRIRTVDEDDNGVLSFLAEELPAGIGTYFTTNTPPAVTATTVDTNVDPGPVNTPALCEPSSAFAQGQSLVLIGASGNANWGGANVFLSLDGTNFSQIGTLTAPALQGVLTASLAAFAGTNPDTTDTLAVDATESLGVWPAVAAVNAQNATSLAWISPQPTSSGGDQVLNAAGELLAFGAVAVTGTHAADLSYLERGLYGTSGIAHSAGDQFTLFDTTGRLGSTLRYQLPPQYIGQPLYLQFQSFNIFGNAAEDLSTVTTYKYTPNGAGFGTGTGGTPSIPTGLAATPGNGQNDLSWSANPVTDNVTSYTLFAAPGLSQPFSSAAVIYGGDALAFTHSGIGNGAAHTYFLTAANSVGSSTHTSGVNCTSNASGIGTVNSVAMTGDGTVFNTTVSGSPITLSGTLAPALLAQAKNAFLAGPASGANAAPTFRALTSADMPLSGAGSGTVTSVGLTVPSRQSVAGSPVTASGTIAISDNNQSANLFFGGPSSGSPAAPTFRALVAGDIPSATALGLMGYTGVNNANYTMLATDRTVATITAAFSAPRTWTLPAASSVAAAQWIYVLDMYGAIGATNTLTLQRAGADTIEGGTSVLLNAAYATAILESDGISRWSTVTTQIPYSAPSNQFLTSYSKSDGFTSEQPTFSNIGGVAAAAQLPTATTSAFGIVEADGSTISISAGVISAVHTGTVTSVGLSLPAIFNVSGSPVTGSGTLTGALATQNANLVLAGPSSGSAAAPTFRSLVAADIPSLSGAYLPLAGGTVTGATIFNDDLTVNGLDVGVGGGGVSGNLALGTSVFNGSTTGTGNVGIGPSSLNGLTSGASNVGVGSGSLFSTTTGIKNMALGGNSAEFNTTGNYNAAIGYESLRENTIGSANTAIAYQSLYNNTSGSQNCATGATALFDLGQAVTAGSFVAGIAYTILTVGTTSFTSIGASANTIGVVFTATGAGSGTGTATPNTNNNTAIGYNTGRGITYGSGNTIIGANVTGLAAGLTNTVILADGTGAIHLTIPSTGQHQIAGALATTTDSYQTPSTGFSITVGNNVERLLLNPSGTLATGTIDMPAVPVDRQRCRIASAQTITTLTMSGNGNTLTGALTTIAANGFAEWEYIASATTWFRVG